MKMRPVRAELFHADGRMDRHDEDYCLFRNFAAGSKNNWHRQTEIIRRTYPTKHLPTLYLKRIATY